METIAELQFAVTPEALLSIFCMSAWCWLFAEVFKQLLPKDAPETWKHYGTLINGSILGWGLLWAFVARLAVEWLPVGGQAWLVLLVKSFLVGLTGTAFATLGYEAIKNGFGFMGLFKREE